MIDSCNILVGSSNIARGSKVVNEDNNALSKNAENVRRTTTTTTGRTGLTERQLRKMSSDMSSKSFMSTSIVNETVNKRRRIDSVIDKSNRSTILTDLVVKVIITVEEIVS